MTKKLLILIDQSIKEPGGHHYEYARRILNAARDQGLATLLLAHREFDSDVDHDVREVFSWTFWEAYRHYYMPRQRRRPPAFLGRLYRRGRLAWLNLQRRVLYSPFGLAMARARHLRLLDIVLLAHVPDDFSNVRSSRFTLCVARSVVMLAAMVKRLGRPIDRLPIKRAMLFVVAAVLSIPGLIALPIAMIRRRRGGPAESFARELTAALEGESFNGDDTILFVPNATAAELDGLRQLEMADRPAAKGHWAFLFRRPIFTGFPSGYAEQSEGVRAHRMELARLRTSGLDLNIRFYTDTDELTEQYNFLGIYPFTTLPVPVDMVDIATRTPSDDAELVIGYLGDARDEKGYQHLPSLVESFSSSISRGSRIKFLFQSNFNEPRGEPGSRYARHVLQGYDPVVVELPRGPFSSAEYGALMERMNIVVIPYASDNYSARSSGVLMEAIAAARPALVPSCSWMARIVEPARQRHLLSIFQDESDALTCCARLTASIETVNDKVWNVDKAANYLFIRMKFDPDFHDFIHIFTTNISDNDITIDSNRASYKAINGEIVAALEKPSSSRLWFKAMPVGTGALPPTCTVEIALFASVRRLPLCAGVAIFDTPAQLLREAHDIVEFYDHHATAAQALRQQLRCEYDPHVLVSRLLTGADMVDAVSKMEPALTKGFTT